jgi:hypothetical protein
MSTSARTIRVHRCARASARLSPAAVLFAALFLCACPKKEWRYAPPPAPAPTEDFDAQFDRTHLDPNGAARNIDWHPQLSGRIPNPDTCNDGQPYTPACTQNKPFQDQPDGINQAFCFIGKAASGSPIQPFFGHADWMVAQFNGTIGWFNFGDDFDYDLFLIPATDQLPPAPPALVNAHGLTTNNNHVADNTNNPPYIEMEFNSDETDTAFTQGFWNDFRTSGEAVNAAALIAQVLHPDPKTLACGSAVGLFGLDCDHGCRSELHPIYGLAIQRTEAPDDNQWSIMARNWGTGGYCSQYNDELAETSLSLLLPYTSSQPPTKVEVKDFVSAANDSTAKLGCPTVYFQDGQTIVNLTLPSPEKQPLAAFSLTIQWPAGAQAVACTQPGPPVPAAMALSPEHANKLNGENYMGALLRAAAQSKNPNLQRPTLEKDILPAVPESQSRMQALRHMALAPPPQPCDGTLTVKTGLPSRTPLKTIHRLQKDPRKQVRDTAVRNYVCRNYKQKQFSLPPGTTQQDFDQACKGVN